MFSSFKTRPTAQLLPAASLFTFSLLLLAPLCRGSGFELRDGDRVALIGDTLIEREQAWGQLETRMTEQFPGRHIIFRNLGWSADTPAGESRASFDFDKPGKGLEVLESEINAVHPTVVIMGYGMACSFEGQAKLAEFRGKLETLVKTIQASSTNGPVRFIFLGPARHEKLLTSEKRPMMAPDAVDAHNRDLRAYSEAIRGIASKLHAPFISLYDLAASPGAPLTENGIHYTSFGYARAAEALAAGLGWDNQGCSISIAHTGKAAAKGADVVSCAASKNGIRLETLDSRLPPPELIGASNTSAFSASYRLQASGLKRGDYELRVDGVAVQRASSRQWAKGVELRAGPQFDQAADLRRAIIQKNKLCFDRWRPQNQTYLFGFRKHEQGQNAKEIPMFDPLIARAETAIVQLSQPKRHVLEIAPVSDSPVPLHSVIGMNAPKNEEENAPKPLPQPTFQVAPGFEVRLFAESPLLAKPIQMNFDAKGRLWVASSAVYPQILPGEKADDKILILEDTNGDGRADKSTVFASGLMIPTTVIPGDDGAYVGQSTELLHFTDRDGDGHADEKKIILSGFGTEDTHHMVHTLRWGPDGRLYFNQSIYIHTHIETPHGVERLNSGGVWRFDPATAELSVFLRGFCNPWGHEIDEFGQSFETDGAGYQGISYGIRGATYFTYAIMRRELPSISPGNYPKFCSLELIRTPQFPPDWQGSAITCDFRAHRVVRFDIQEKGAGYAAHEVADLLRSTNVTFRPIDVKLGPDGALYVADWANPIIQHGEVDFRDPRRDHEHGRIWRITAKDRPALPRRDLTRASNWELLDLLIGSPEGEEHIGQNGLPEGLNTYDQQQARRVLAERGLSIRKDLGAWTRARRSDFAQLQALWLYESLDVVEPKLLERVLHAKDGRVRAAATRVAGFWHGALPNALDLLAERVADDHPRVRLEAVRALAEIPTAHSAALVLSALDKPMDSFLDYAVWLSINDLANPWLESVKRGDWRPEGHEHQLEFALKALEPSLATTVLGKVMENRALSSDGKGPWIELIGSGGDSRLLRRLFDQAVAGGFDSGAVTRVFKALNTAARERGVKPEGSLGNLAALLDGKGGASKVPLTRAGRVELLRLAGNWKLTECIPQLAAAANSDALGMEERRAALDALRDIGGAKAIETLARLGNRNNFALRREAVERLAPLDIERASAPAVSILTNSISDDDATELWRALLSAKNAGPVLAHALPKSGLSAGMAKAGLRVAREGNRNEPDLVWALTRGAGLEDASQTLSDAELKALAADAMQRGDPARGERIFRRADMACIKCHSIGGVGGKVGPDLTSVGASAQPDYLVESVLYPNRKIKEGYHAVSVETKDGLEYTGVLVKESPDQLILRDASGKENTVAKNNIDNRVTGGSLMPSGLVDGLTAGERLDLFRFLAELGKPGPYDASKGTVARSWRLLVQTLDLAQFGDDKALHTGLDDKQWETTDSLVDGDLLKENLVNAMKRVASRDPTAVYAATRFEAAKSGPVDLKLLGARPVMIWLDGKAISAAGLSHADVSAGTHVFIAKISAKNFPDALKLESSDVTFLND